MKKIEKSEDEDSRDIFPNLKVNSKVHHNKFGLGIVKDIQTNGIHKIAYINFEREIDTKKILLAYAKMKVLKTKPMSKYVELPKHYLSQKIVDQVINCLKEGGLIVYPTDTVYAIGCLSTITESAQRLANIKEQKLSQANLTFLFSELKQLTAYVGVVNNAQFKFLKRNTPSPITFVMDVKAKLPKPFDRRKSIGTRIPKHPFLHRLLSCLDAPLLTTSLYDEDQVVEYTTDPAQIFENWDNRVDMIINGGFGNNVPSTVVDLSKDPYQILRQGIGDFN